MSDDLREIYGKICWDAAKLCNTPWDEIKHEGVREAYRNGAMAVIEEYRRTSENQPEQHAYFGITGVKDVTPGA